MAQVIIDEKAQGALAAEASAVEAAEQMERRLEDAEEVCESRRIYRRDFRELVSRIISALGVSQI